MAEKQHKPRSERERPSIRVIREGDTRRVARSAMHDDTCDAPTLTCRLYIRRLTGVRSTRKHCTVFTELTRRGSKRSSKLSLEEVRVVRGQPWPPAAFACREGLMHIGFITMEPKTLFVPQYLDSSITLFVHRGGVKVGYIHKDELVERKLKMGDVLHIDAGSTFCLVNTGKGQRLQIICSIDASDSLGFGPPYQAFYLGGAGHPASVISGFGPKTLGHAFNERGQGNGHDDVRDRGARCEGAGAWRPGGRGDEGDECGSDDARRPTWSWRKLVNRFIGGAGGGGVTLESNKKGKKKGGAPEPYNLYDSEPGFRNSYGWTVSVDKQQYEPLKHPDIGVYLVNLTSGSMLAPHVNPRATEYGVEQVAKE
ncbi:unnamed protein product [Miscanthus lutarioriparius]|uniref:Cupin type-1 domain-containing protein n=1 Tax=Miscanthus lutarioriparius TaxID=422564 RepID=A0A811MCF8_9POAL|nr:unnamed protein product [Miscanthus lutarioriparius]